MAWYVRERVGGGADASGDSEGADEQQMDCDGDGMQDEEAS